MPWGWCYEQLVIEWRNERLARPAGQGRSVPHLQTLDSNSNHRIVTALLRIYDIRKEKDCRGICD